MPAAGVGGHCTGDTEKYQTHPKRHTNTTHTYPPARPDYKIRSMQGCKAIDAVRIDTHHAGLCSIMRVVPYRTDTMFLFMASVWLLRSRAHVAGAVCHRLDGWRSRGVGDAADRHADGVSDVR